MAAVRSDCRIARAGAGMRAEGPVRRRRRNSLPTIQRKNGRIDSHPRSARNDQITVALTARGRGRHHRPRGMSTRIRALVQHKASDASTVTLG
jgi:hypothetical protein